MSRHSNTLLFLLGHRRPLLWNAFDQPFSSSSSSTLITVFKVGADARLWYLRVSIRQSAKPQTGREKTTRKKWRTTSASKQDKDPSIIRNHDLSEIRHENSFLFSFYFYRLNGELFTNWKETWVDLPWCIFFFQPRVRMWEYVAAGETSTPVTSTLCKARIPIFLARIYNSQMSGICINCWSNSQLWAGKENCSIAHRWNARTRAAAAKHLSQMIQQHIELLTESRPALLLHFFLGQWNKKRNEIWIKCESFSFLPLNGCYFEKNWSDNY